MKDANRAAWAEEQRSKRESERPATAIETKIAEALKATMTGTEFAEALDKAGLTITRATAADVQALDALRQDDQLAAAAGIEASGRRFAMLEIGDVAAVTRGGDVFQLSPHKLDLTEIEQRLGKPAPAKAGVQPRLASVTEARAFNQLSREQTAEMWAERRAENTAQRVANSEAWDADREIRADAVAARHERQEISDTAEQLVDTGTHALAGIANGLAKIVETAYGLLFGWAMAAPKLTQDQAERQHFAAEEQQTASATVAEEQDKAAAVEALISEQDREKKQRAAEATYFRPIYRPSEIERDEGRERGRERE